VSKKVKLFLCLTNYAIKMYGGLDVRIHLFMFSTLIGGGCLVSRHGRLTPPPEGKVPPLSFGSEAGWAPESVWSMSRGLELRPLGHAFLGQSLYRLSYPGSCRIVIPHLNTGRNITDCLLITISGFGSRLLRFQKITYVRVIFIYLYVI
jgi:hypothetical protein